MSPSAVSFGFSIQALLEAFSTAMQNNPHESGVSGSDAILRLVAGDASDRKFYRLENTPDKAICMQFPKWEGGYGGDPLSWLGMQAALKEIGIPVPEVLLIDKENCCIWTEDFGDCFLNFQLPSPKFDMIDSSSQATLSFYEQALSLLVHSQYPKIRIGPHPAENRFFDFEKLFFEMKFFLLHFIDNFLEEDRSKNKPFWDEFETELVSLCEWLGNRERVLCHRDYHVRNVMIVDQKAKWIDFQDARMGPHTYDVVSLVRDSYVCISPNTKLHLYNHYLTQLNERRRALNLTELAWDELNIEAQHMGLQRNIKALGSFGYLATVKRKPSYLQYVKNTLQTILEPSATLNVREKFPRVLDLAQNLLEGTRSEFLEEKIRRLGIQPL